ncbi:putative membrane protein [cyanobiont of Ornithocercus magnificus]|nr:putative membrane protein [cyanobiont of Ornithocercus magnificus]
MSETTIGVENSATGSQKEIPANAEQISAGKSSDFAKRYGEIISNINTALDKVDWSKVSLASKVVGIFIAVSIIQVLIKGILDTINLLPIIPGILELLGVVVVGQWSWKNLTTLEKRNALIEKAKILRREYLG